MHKILLLTTLLITSTTVLADDTTTQTCANGAGIVATGSISGQKYCVSNKTMNWWNAHTWCNAIGKRLFSMDNCACTSETNCVNICSELKTSLSNRWWGWTSTPKDASSAYAILLSVSTGNIYEQTRSFSYDGGTMVGYHAICQ